MPWVKSPHSLPKKTMLLKSSIINICLQYPHVLFILSEAHPAPSFLLLAWAQNPTGLLSSSAFLREHLFTSSPLSSWIDVRSPCCQNHSFTFNNFRQHRFSQPDLNLFPPSQRKRPRPTWTLRIHKTQYVQNKTRTTRTFRHPTTLKIDEAGKSTFAISLPFSKVCSRTLKQLVLGLN